MKSNRSIVSRVTWGNSAQRKGYYEACARCGMVVYGVKGVSECNVPHSQRDVVDKPRRVWLSFVSRLKRVALSVVSVHRLGVCQRRRRAKPDAMCDRGSEWNGQVSDVSLCTLGQF